MNEFTLLPDDPRLTAYALGELDGDERAAVEAWLRSHPEARAVVDDIRAAAAHLEQALAREPMVSASRMQRVDPYSPARRSKVLRFPQIYYVVGGLAAACFAVVLALREPPSPHLVRHQVEIALPPLEPAPTTDAVAAVPPANVALPAPADEADARRGPPVAPGEFDLIRTGLLEQSKLRSVTLAIPGAPAMGAGESPAVTFSALPQRPDPMSTAAVAETKLPALGPVPANGQLASAASDKGDAQVRMATYERKAAMAAMSRASAEKASSATAAGRDIGFVDVMRHRLAAETAGFGADVREQDALATESYDFRRENGFLSATENPLSTFSADVDTASYANIRRMLERGQRPPVDAVRIEEMLNYFPYSYAAPTPGTRDGEGLAADGAAPFAASMEVAEAPWAPAHRLVRIGLKGREVTVNQRGAANLVFLIDVSGSMNQPNRLPLVKESLRLLLGRLRADDRVAIVTYAGASGLALPSTPVSKARDILEAIDALTPGGSTNGAMGIHLAYDVAKANFAPGGINRVILCTDGDFNVGVTSTGELVRLITEKAKSGVYLTALGFGMGNFKDATLQHIADAGNGNYGYIDRRREAEKLLVEQVSGTLVTIAKDVKFQVEFNPAKVASYRLIGYEKRLLKKEDFNNDAVDAGEIGAGHTVTALYEIVPAGAEETRTVAAVDALKYQKTDTAARARIAASQELLTLKVGYKDPAGAVSRKLEFPLVDEGRRFVQASGDFKFASAVAAFGMILRDSAYKGAVTLAEVGAWAEAGAGADPGGYRAEFLSLVQQARKLM